MTISAPPAPSPAPSTLSRAQIVALGQTGSPWVFVPVALAALAQHPDDAEVRFLLAAAYARLLLPTSAAEQLALLPDDARADPGVRALADLLPTLPDDRVPHAALLATLASNLAALAAHPAHPVDLRPRVNAWKLLNTPVEWFRARSGSLVRRKKADPAAWLQFSDQAHAAREFVPPHLADNASPPPPYVVQGADPPFLLARILEAVPVQPDGHAPLITLLQADELELLTGLCQLDLAAHLASPRLRVCAGPAAIKAWIDDRAATALSGVAVKGPCLSVPTLKTRISPAPEDLLTGLIVRQQHEYARLAAAAAARWSTPDPAALARRFAAASAGADPAQPPLRVLIPTYRHSTFVRHAADDLAAAFTARGCQARVLIEPDDHSSLTNLAYLKALDDFSPDLVVQINYTRANLGSVIPPGVVFATWIQDAMGHLFDAGAGRAMGPTDFLLGATRDDLFQFFAYPRSRAMYWPMVASSRKFHDTPPEPDQRHRLACDIAYVSHHGLPPRALHDQRVAMARASTPALVGVFESLYPELERFLDSPALMDPRMSFRARALTAAALAAHNLHPSDHAVTQVLNAYTLQILDRLLRHQTLAWAADIARRRGWSLHIHGKDWHAAPALAPFARPPLAHGDDLRACYHAARAHLQVSAHTVIHQRIAECALSGGLALCRLQGDDLGTLEFQAGALALLDGAAPVASDATTVLELGYRFQALRAGDHPATRAHADLLAALGLPRPDLLWMNPVQIDLVRRRKTFQGHHTPALALLGDPASTLFASPSALETALERAIHDDDWRSAARARAADAARASLTYDALVDRTLAFIAARLADPSPDDDREWFDGRPRP